MIFHFGGQAGAGGNSSHLEKKIPKQANRDVVKIFLIFLVFVANTCIDKGGLLKVISD